jgi:DNA polymerase III delta prime subunit
MFGLSRIHHAYFIEGGDFEYVTNELKKIDFIVQANPDFWHLNTENLTINEARTIKDIQSQRAIAGEHRVFVIETFAMTGEAQNALLKVFEEPTAGSLFIVIAPSAHILLPTLRSRMVVIVKEKTKTASSLDTKKFIANGAAKRIEMLKPILEFKDAEGNKRADKKAAVAFLSALRFEIKDTDIKGLGAIDEALIYLFDKSSSVKILLENVSISLCTIPELSKKK